MENIEKIKDIINYDLKTLIEIKENYLFHMENSISSIYFPPNLSSKENLEELDKSLSFIENYNIVDEENFHNNLFLTLCEFNSIGKLPPISKISYIVDILLENVLKTECHLIFLINLEILSLYYLKLVYFDFKNKNPNLEIKFITIFSDSFKIINIENANLKLFF